MNRAIVLDRDGTINADKDYLYRIEDFEFIDGVQTALKMLKDKGYKLIIITNQSGIARGFYTESDFAHIMDWMQKKLGESGISIDGIYFCPHLENATVDKYRKTCQCRKPAIGLFEQAAQEHNIDWTQSYAIGDKIRDLAICLCSECKGYLINSNEKSEIIEDVKSGKYNNIRYEENLLKCAKAICEKE